MEEANDDYIFSNNNTNNAASKIDSNSTSILVTYYDDDDDDTADNNYNNNEENQQSYLSETQETVLAFLPIFSALLSIIGSLIIIRLIIRSKFRKPYRRILFGMSCYDILNSITVTLQTFLVPEQTSRRLYAIGNDNTCQALGFLFQFSYPSFCYFGILSIYYVLVVKWNVTDAFFARYIEPILHSITLLWPTITAFLGLHLGLYGEVSIGAGCWISEQASNSICHQSDDDTNNGNNDNGNNNNMQECIEQWTWIMGGLPFMIVFAIVLINNLLIYCHVRTTIFRVTRRRRIRQQQHGQASSSTGLSSSHNNNNTINGGGSSPPPPSRCASMSPEAQEAKVRAVGTQALLYCGVFLLTYCWTIVLRLASNNGDGPPQEPHLFPIMVLRAIFLPAMGLGTVLVYTRPRYIMMRKIPAYKQKGGWWAIRQVLWDDDDLTGGAGNNNNAAGGGGSGSSSSRTNGNHVSDGPSSSSISTFFMLGGGNSLRGLLLRMPSSDGRSSSLKNMSMAFSPSRESNDDMLLSPIEEEEDKKGDDFVKDTTECHCRGEEEEEEEESGVFSHPGVGEEEEEEGIAGVLGVVDAGGREDEEEVCNFAMEVEDVGLVEKTENEFTTDGQ